MRIWWKMRGEDECSARRELFLKKGGKRKGLATSCKPGKKVVLESTEIGGGAEAPAERNDQNDLVPVYSPIL